MWPSIYKSILRTVVLEYISNVSRVNVYHPGEIIFYIPTCLLHTDDFYTPRFNEVDRGVYWYHLVRLSVCPSVHLSVCGQNRVRSVSSTILIGSISYLHILSSNLRRCVTCNARFKIWNFVEFFKCVTLTLSSFDLGSSMTQWYG